MRLPLLSVVLASAATAQAPPRPPPADDEWICLIEVQPELVGGLEGLQERLVYPESARRDSVEGRVVVQFVVTGEGDVTEPTVLRSSDDRLDAAAITAVRASTFVPGRQRGRPVAVRFAVPVTFRLPGPD